MSSIGLDKPKRIDARALRTRHLLVQALISLGAVRGVEELEIGHIVEEAGVARSTFYAHYEGKDDFLVRSFVNMIAATDVAVRARYPEREHLLPSRELFAHVHQVGDFALRMARSAIFPAQMAAGEAKLREIVEANLARLRPEWPHARRADSAVYIAGGFMGLLRWWMQTGLRRSPEEMERAFQGLTRNALAE